MLGLSSLRSYLIEITADIFRYRDEESGQALIDLILDATGMKGTGKWTVQQASELGAPIPTIASAVEARILSAMKPERVRASRLLGAVVDPPQISDRAAFVEDVRRALYASKLCSYAQGMFMMKVASDEYKWSLDLGEIARIWKGGCIIRARFLGRIQAAYGRQKRLANLLLDEELGGFVQRHQDAWRRVVALAAMHGVPALAMGASLSWYDSFRRAQLPQNLTQAQRDLFGAHTFERTDRPAGQFFHREW